MSADIDRTCFIIEFPVADFLFSTGTISAFCQPPSTQVGDIPPALISSVVAKPTATDIVPFGIPSGGQGVRRRLHGASHIAINPRPMRLTLFDGLPGHQRRKLQQGALLQHALLPSLPLQLRDCLILDTISFLCAHA